MKHIVLWLALLMVMVGGAIVSGLDGGRSVDSYRVMKRQWTDYKLARTLSPVPCPKSAYVVVAIGQSNAGNHIEGLTPMEDNSKAYSFFWGRCYLIEDPLPGATGKKGSLWALFAQRLARQMSHPVVVIAGGAAGSSISNWHKDTAGMFSRLARRIKNAHRQGFDVDLVLWHQGEEDGKNKMPGERYEQLLNRLIEKFDRTIAREEQSLPRWLIFQVSRCWNKTSINPEIRAAQRAVAAGNERVQEGPDTDRLGDEYRYDRCHFNVAGRERIVTDLLDQLEKLKDWSRLSLQGTKP